ncbi:hypothetical protein C8F04DRAFT_22887 [Mycena alexandri]|uniref:F-box domain-containing protein n=1 Tax=Mycena alexandri TaxID=1745969 RepID=A0AAD6XH27_9AGAR|nr:hypothetical protein C8F04DRAFT_22887 [Mycena alexandri]
MVGLPAGLNFHQLLRTNTLPTDFESKEVDNLLSSFTGSLKEIDDEIAQIDASLSALKQRRNRLHQAVAAHRAVLSPARKLHEDVVREIFVSCISSSRNGTMHPSHSPLLLGQICSEWRNIALTTPQLWASLHVPIPPASRMEQISNLVVTWLGRSGALPLSISITISQACTADRLASSKSVSNLLDILTSFSHRWKRVQFISPSSSFFYQPELLFTSLAKLFPESVPMLEEVTFDFYSYPMFDLQSLPFLHAPGIRSVSFSSMAANIQSLPLPWAVVTELQVGGTKSSLLSVAAALQILNKCPNIQICVMHIALPDLGDFAEEILLPHLRHISLISQGYAPAQAFFANLNLPALKSLKYVSTERHTTLPFTSLLSGCVQLEALDIEVKGLSRTELFDCFQHVHSTIVSLRLHLMTEGTSGWPGFIYPPPILDDKTINLLTPKLGSKASCLFPRLEHLELAGCAGLSDRALLDLIQKREERSWQGSRFVRVDVAFTREMQIDILSQLLKGRVSGRPHVSLRYAEPSKQTLGPPYSTSEGADSVFAHL